MTTITLEKLIWAAVFVGLVIGAFGLSLQRSDDALGWSLVVLGGVLIAAGATGIVVRSRMED